ncbi:MAG: sigma 54-interacting transcriptional regulator, partial [Planctomycetes bacterium]|nr:sigma 54-interacting transcriptional regulator [Planctomycetota bacterium]
MRSARSSLLRGDPDLDLEAPPPPHLGRFQPAAFLGRGSFGAVWLVTDPLRPGKELAIKVLHPAAGRRGSPAAPSGEAAAALVKEFRFGLAVRHPALVEVLEAGILEAKDPAQPPRPYLISEFVPGRPLRPPVEAADLVPMAQDLLSALDAVHAAGWRHGDLKPENLLFSIPEPGARPEVRLLDFGLAAELEKISERPASAGTPLYFSPEMLKGGRPDQRSDLYALGVVLYECLRGSMAGSLSEHLLETRKGLFFQKVLKADLPEPLGRLVRRLLEPDTEARLESGREGLAILEGAAPAETSAPLVPPFESPRTIGRAGFFEAMDEALAGVKARRPRPALISVEGGRGLGKTRVLQEAQAAAFAAGVRALTWTQAKSLALPEVPGSAPAGSAGPLEPGELAERRSDAFDRKAAAILQGLLREPALLAVDDLDRLLDEDERLLRSLIEKLRTLRDSSSRRRPPGHFPAVVVSWAALPEVKQASAWSRILELPWASRCALRPWSEEETAAFLEQALRPRHELEPLLAALHRQAEGVPGRLRSILRELGRAGELRFERGGWRCARAPDADPVPVPGERELWLEEWRQASEAAREAAGMAALLSEGGGKIAAEHLAAILERPRAAVEERLRELERRDLLRFGLEGSGSEGEMLAVDRRRRAWILRSAGAPARKRWRLAAARSSLPLGEVLCQELRAGEPSWERVLEASAAPGRLSEHLLGYYSRCSRFPAAGRAAAALRLGEMLHQEGRGRRGERSLKLAAALDPDGPGRSRAETLLGELALARRDPEAAAGHFNRAREAGGMTPEIRRRWHFGLAVAEAQRNRAEPALELARGAKGEFPEAPELIMLSANLALALGGAEEAESDFLQAIRLSDAPGSERLKAAAQTNYGRLLARESRYQEAAALHRQAAENFEKAGSRSGAARALLNLGTALRRLGDFEGSAQAAERSRSIARELGDDLGAAFAEANLGILARELGLLGTAARHLQAAREGSGLAGEGAAAPLSETPLFLENQALIAAECGRLEEARRIHLRLAERYGGKPHPLSPEEFLLHLRLLVGGSLKAGEVFEVCYRKKAMENPDAPALSELARLEALHPELCREGKMQALLKWGREELERLAGGSERARFYQQLAELECARDPQRARAAREHLEPRAATFPERLARCRALAALAKSEANGEKRVFSGLLRKTIDEILFDLDPEVRPSFLARRDVQEALQWTLTMESKEPSTAKVAAALREVFRLNREILDEEDLDKLFRRIVDAAIQLTGAERGFLALRREGRLAYLAARAAGRDLADPESQISRTVLERTIAGGVPCLATDAREDMKLRSIASVEELGLRSVICVPLRRKNRVLGALYLDNPFERSVFEPGDLELVESFCGQAILAWTAAEKRQEIKDLLRRLRESNRQLHGELSLSRRDARRRSRREEKVYCGIAGDSAAMRRVFELIEVVAPADIPVLITGESGTGKELVARAIFQQSRRNGRPFVAENCGAVPAGLLESALFGHVKGAFTGADRDQPGLFEMASGGTLFLDEIAELPLELQNRLLRVLQEGEVRPVGGRKVLKVDVRIIAATNHAVRDEVAQGKFREDLYYRLQGAEIHLPPLRERAEDIPLLAERFLDRINAKEQKARRLAPETMERLMRYPWPGNVRELENEIRRLALLSRTEAIGPECLSAAIREGAAMRPPRGLGPGSEVRPLLEVERQAILHA